MTYFDLASYEEMLAKREAASIKISVDLLNYKTDRTLTLGKNLDGITLHVFIKDGILHAHEYLEFYHASYRTVNWHVGKIQPALLIPSLHAIPLATDVEFAELMLQKSHPLSFLGWKSSFNHAEESDSGYFGEIVRQD